MKKIIVTLILFVSVHLYSMEYVVEYWDYNDDQDYIPRHDYTYRETLESPAYGAKIECHGDSYLVKRMQKPGTFIGYLKGIADITTYSIPRVIPGNITLLKNADGSYDVLYRTDDDVVVAQNLETGQKLYEIRLMSSQEGQGKLFQSHDGLIVVTDKNRRNAISWSHPRLKQIMQTQMEANCAAIVPNEDLDE